MDLPSTVMDFYRKILLNLYGYIISSRLLENACLNVKHKRNFSTQWSRNTMHKSKIPEYIKKIRFISLVVRKPIYWILSSILNKEEINHKYTIILMLFVRQYLELSKPVIFAKGFTIPFMIWLHIQYISCIGSKTYWV